MYEADKDFRLTDQAIKSFWSKTEKRIGSDCLWWTGAKKPTGYGRMSIQGKNLQAHRIAYLIQHGSIPSGMHILHSCDNPSCVNHEHLSTGTHVENMKQRHARGRYVFNYNGNHYLQKDSTVVRGSNNSRAVINEEIAFQMRLDFAQGKFKSKADGARLYGVSITVMQTVLSGRTWKHVPFPENFPPKRTYSKKKSMGLAELFAA
jgi:hypothetical protein